MSDPIEVKFATPMSEGGYIYTAATIREPVEDDQRSEIPPFIEGWSVDEALKGESHSWGADCYELDWRLAMHADVVCMQHYINYYVHPSGAQFRLEYIYPGPGGKGERTIELFWFAGRTFATEAELIEAMGKSESS